MLKAFRILLVLCFTSPLLAQQANVTSLVPSANYGSDSINLQTLVPVINVPVRSKDGPIPFSAGFGGFVGCGPGGSPLTWSCGTSQNFSAAGLHWTLSPSTTTSTSCSGHTVNEYTNWFISDISGNSWHPLPTTLSPLYSGYCAGSITGTTTDGSGLTATITTTWNSVTLQMTVTASIVDKLGNTASFPSGVFSGIQPILNASNSFTDPFGNAITFGSSKYVEPINPSGYALEQVCSPTCTGYKYLDATGTAQTVTINSASDHYKTNFGCGTVTEEDQTGIYTVTGYSFPDSTSETFDFESIAANTITGRVKHINLRTGGQVQYTYGFMDCTQYRPLSLTRVGADGTTTFTASVSGSHNGSTTTVLDPGKNKIVYTFTGYFGTNSTPSLTNIPALTQVQTYQNTGTVGSPTYTLLTTDLYCYNGNTTSCASAAVAYPITEISVTHTINGMSNSSKVNTFFDGGNSGGCAGGTANCYGNVTEVDNYDFGGSTPTQKKIIAYGTSSSAGSTSCSAIGSGIFGKPCYIETDMGTNKVAFSNFKYNTTTAPGFVINRYDLTTSGNYLTTAYSPNSNGTVASVTDPNGTATSFSYSTSTGCPSSGTGLLPTGTSVTVATGDTLTTSTSYECNGGTVTGTTDDNGNSSTIAFNDSMFRLSSYADPYSYTWTPSYSSTSVSGSSTKFNTNASQHITNAVVDTFGRPITSQIGQGPSSSNYDTVSTSYGWGGTNSTNKMVSTSEPCTAASGANCASFAHSVQFDPLGRPISAATTSNETVATTYSQNDVLSVLSPAPTNENAKQVQNEYDGLGRLTSSCAPSSTASGKVSCGQNVATSPTTGILTSTSYTSAAASQTVSSTRGSETRSKTFDGLGRVSNITTPEAGSVGYTYDSVNYGKCGNRTSSGDLLTILRNSGGYICFWYDALHRVTDVGESASLTAWAGHAKRFRYDSSTIMINGQTMTPPTGYVGNNLKGRLVEAETDDYGTPPTTYTDEWFSYDKDGRITDMWELTPNSGQYYHSVATYYPDGTLDTVQLASPSRYTVTYGIDGEARWNNVTAGTQSIVSSATFTEGDQPLTVPLQGTDQDTYTYDSNTGLMTKFKFVVGTANLTGQPTYNTNNSVKSLAITDGFNSGGSVTCYFTPPSGTNAGYDDLGRLLQTNCPANGTTWNQTFSYDQYDNLTKASTGPGVSWNPGYNTSNHYTLAGTTYDSDGNLTDDSFHNYTWEIYGPIATIDQSGTNCATSGECVTYDAFDRIAEVDSGSTKTEYWYTQAGKVLMNGTTSNYAWWDAPGGTARIDGACNPNSCTYYWLHRDWVGSARIISNVAANTVATDEAYAPYGEVFNIQAGGSGLRNRSFASMTEDIVDGTADTPNREYNRASQGRFLSPDPAGSGWNQYAYATNPNSFNDPLGLCEVGDSSCVPGAENPQMPGEFACVIFCDTNYDTSIYAPSMFDLSYYAPGLKLVNSTSNSQGSFGGLGGIFQFLNTFLGAIGTSSMGPGHTGPWCANFMCAYGGLGTTMTPGVGPKNLPPSPPPSGPQYNPQNTVTKTFGVSTDYVQKNGTAWSVGPYPDGIGQTIEVFIPVDNRCVSGTPTCTGDVLKMNGSATDTAEGEAALQIWKVDTQKYDGVWRVTVPWEQVMINGKPAGPVRCVSLAQTFMQVPAGGACN